MIKFSYLEYIKILPQNNKQAGKPMVKWTRYLKKHFTRDDSKWSININMCSNSIAIREMATKTTVWCCTPTRKAKVEG
jgi:hypothetical protein